VLYNMAQDLTEEEKAQARANIGAAAPGEGGSGSGSGDDSGFDNTGGSDEEDGEPAIEF